MHASFEDAKKAPPTSIIENRPEFQKNLQSANSDMHKQLADLDEQIQKYANDREALSQKAATAKNTAESLLQQYHDQQDIQQKYQQQMQTLDGNIAQLVNKKAEISRQLKK
jgi:chromosome segregation ATPase